MCWAQDEQSVYLKTTIIPVFAAFLKAVNFKKNCYLVCAGATGEYFTIKSDGKLW